AGTTVVSGSEMTWLTSPAPFSAGLRLAVSHQESYPFREAFSIASGDSEFDQRFAIKTNDGPFARVWLDEHVRDCIAASDGYHFILEDGSCRAWRFCSGGGDDELARAMRALAALSERGRLLHREWLGLADRLGGKLIAAPAHATSGGAMVIHVKLAHATVAVAGFFGALGRRRPGRGVLTRVRCTRPTPSRDYYAIHDALGRRALRPRLPVPLHPLLIDHPAVADRYRIECQDPDLAAQRFDRRLCERIIAAQPEIIIGDPRQVTVFFLEFEVDVARMRAGVAIAESLAVDVRPQGLAGPYR
ncbi:MAG: hypothetical protein AAGC55_17325, partial [Myxococcota bacterium]